MDLTFHPLSFLSFFKPWCVFFSSVRTRSRVFAQRLVFKWSCAFAGVAGLKGGDRRRWGKRRKGRCREETLACQPFNLTEDWCQWTAIGIITWTCFVLLLFNRFLLSLKSLGKDRVCGCWKDFYLNLSLFCSIFLLSQRIYSIRFK